jgi:transposase
MRNWPMTTIRVKQARGWAPERRVRQRRDFAAMEERRMRAADLFEQGIRPAEIARQLGVCHQVVSDWRNAWRRSGREGLRGAGRAGRLPKLSLEQLAQVESALIQGAAANGYPNDLWTLQRAAQVIQRVTGVSYHPAATSPSSKTCWKPISIVGKWRVCVNGPSPQADVGHPASNWTIRACSPSCKPSPISSISHVAADFGCVTCTRSRGRHPGIDHSGVPPRAVAL